MPEVDVRHGMFSWADLSTPDPSSAKRFYATLFGWDARDEPAGDHGVYTMFERKGRAVAGMGEQSPDMQEGGVSPSWNSYVTVDDVDASAAQVEEAGGTICVPAFDAGVGRICVVDDPAGATFTLFRQADDGA